EFQSDATELDSAVRTLRDRLISCSSCADVLPSDQLRQQLRLLLHQWFRSIRMPYRCRFLPICRTGNYSLFPDCKPQGSTLSATYRPNADSLPYFRPQRPGILLGHSGRSDSGMMIRVESSLPGPLTPHSGVCLCCTRAEERIERHCTEWIYSRSDCG